ncbi:uncharacterized protein KGF55_000344 [Candida pseudojiufengensis]|uniref:uncharacterized protein n=1 Tax=Candida pseudojiufengensis TaxID=497109 RepID=UPI0022249853|nr:uncharacterized protein KGF55_000344 [Candida pseudojiufengensis]KAI5966935.1 hypothetical protein KGF55_000344 [Candida pseudojiufengensis]
MKGTNEDNFNLTSNSQSSSNILLQDEEVDSNNTTITQEPTLSSSTFSSPNTSSSSTSANNTTTHNDLESQSPPRLTPKQRIIRIINHLFPIKQTYERLNNGIQTGRMQHNSPGRFIGQGTDGVFQNLMAKPETLSMIQQQERDLFPPTYEEASQDSSPEYWESTMISPMYEDEVFVQGLPVGNIANFIWNSLVTIAFQFIGFILCYLLHTSHAAKQGSRLGFGINLIMYGWNILPIYIGSPKKIPKKYIINDYNEFENIDKNFKFENENLKIDNYSPSGFFIQDSGANNNNDSTGNDDNYTTAPYIAYGLISFGLFIIIKSIVDFYKIKQLEKSILNPNGGGNIVNQSVTSQVESPNFEETNNESQQQSQPPQQQQQQSRQNIDESEDDPTEMR